MYFVGNLVLKSGHALSDANFLMPPVIGFTHDKQLLGFTPTHTPSLLSQELAALSSVLHGVSGLSLVPFNIRALGHFLEYLCFQCQRQKWI